MPRCQRCQFVNPTVFGCLTCGRTLCKECMAFGCCAATPAKVGYVHQEGPPVTEDDDDESDESEILEPTPLWDRPEPLEQFDIGGSD